MSNTWAKDDVVRLLNESEKEKNELLLMVETLKREKVIAKEINDALIEQKQKLQAELNEYRNAILGMSVMLKNREWANLLSTNDAIAELDVQITNLHDELSQEKRDSLDCDDIKDLKLALSWMGYSTPESIEESVARQKHLIRDLIRSVLRQKESMTVGGE